MSRLTNLYNEISLNDNNLLELDNEILSTDNLEEGENNKYYSNALARQAFTFSNSQTLTFIYDQETGTLSGEVNVSSINGEISKIKLDITKLFNLKLDKTEFNQLLKDFNELQSKTQSLENQVKVFKMEIRIRVSKMNIRIRVSKI